MKKQLLILMLITCCMQVNAQLTISGKLLSKQDKKPVPYASIIEITEEIGATTSDINGEFKLEIDTENKRDKIFISALGYKDTVIVAGDYCDSPCQILLQEQSFMLSEIKVNPNSSMKVGTLGEPLAKVKVKGGFASEHPGEFRGVYYKLKHGQHGTINTVYVNISESKGFYNTPFTLQLLASTFKEKPNHMYKISRYPEMLQEAILVEPDKPGWYEIDLSKYNIALPEYGFYVFVKPMERGGKYWDWIIEGRNCGSYYGMCISSYQNKEKGVFWAHSHREYFGHSTVPKNVDKDFTPPAIAVSYTYY